MSAIKFTPVVIMTGFLFSSPHAYGLGRCAMGDGGGSNVRLHVPGISPSDVVNGAENAWRKIAEAAASAGRDTQVGFINFTITTRVMGETVSVPGTFPMEFEGMQSLTAEILQFRGLSLPGGKDPHPCDPDKNACCDECAAQNGWALIGPALDALNGGFFVRREVAMAGRRLRFDAASMKVEMV